MVILNLKAFFITITIIITECHSEKSRNSRDYGIVEKSEDVTVQTGEEFYVFCRGSDGGDLFSNDDWKTCQWRRESDQRSCRYEYKCIGDYCDYGIGQFYVESNCDQDLEDLLFKGDDPNVANQICGIRVPNAGAEDDSKWTCIIQQCLLASCGQDVGNGVFVQDSVNVHVV